MLIRRRYQRRNENAGQVCLAEAVTKKKRVLLRPVKAALKLIAGNLLL